MDTFEVIIETPKGQGLKYDFEPLTRQLKLSKVMPNGLVFPFDFGFIQGTKGEDGDPLDVVVIAEVATFPGCKMDCRIIGALKGQQTERDGKIFRNDRYIAIPEVSTLYQNIESLKQLPKEIIDQIATFFINYNQQAKKHFKLAGKLQAKQANQLVARNQSKHIGVDLLVQFFLPLYDQKGKEFPDRYFNTIKAELTERFGGITFYFRSPVLGMWKPEQKVVKDELVVVEILAHRGVVSFFKNYKSVLEKKFKQDEIMMRLLNLSLL